MLKVQQNYLHHISEYGDQFQTNRQPGNITLKKASKTIWRFIPGSV